MNQFTQDILQTMIALDKATLDINDLQESYDINSDNFVSAFQYLESNGLITPISTNNCGLKISADGMPIWSVVPFIVSNNLSSDSSEKQKTETINSWLIRPTIQKVVEWAIIGILALLVTIYWPSIQNKLGIQIHENNNVPAQGT